MTGKIEKGVSDLSVAIHQYYMDIINCMPNIVYWIDLDCALKGANHNFVKLLGLVDLKNFKGSPYELIKKNLDWPDYFLEAMKLDDMTAIFSEKAQYQVEEQPIKTDHGKILCYLSTRVPLFNKKKQVIGLVVVLTDVTDQKQSDNLPKKSKSVLKKQKLLLKNLPRILMVEDNLIAQKVEQALMISLGCQVDMAETGELAVSLFSPGKYDLVFMDIGLQDTSGYIVAKKLREQEKGSGYHVPIIALTSYQADIVKYDCRDYFMDGVITKPLTTEQAQQIIRNFVYDEDISVEGLATA